jgi:steroid delta-isomerase-like uncharacterized protein
MALYMALDTKEVTIVNNKILQSAAAALESLDADKLVSRYADEFLFEDAPGNLRITSKERLELYYRNLFALPDVKFEVTSMFGCDAWAGLEWIWSGTTPGQGTEYRIKGASIIEIRDGRIARETIYYDPRTGPG